MLQYTHTLPALAYDYTALEPHIDARTMEIHHTKHHQGYINKYHAALEGSELLETYSPDDILRNIDEVSDDIRDGVINNVGGNVNHTLFWYILSPQGGGEPT